MSWDEAGFKEKLENNHDFPCTYIFKFIVKPKNQPEVEALVPGADIKLKASSGNKYVSVTIKAQMANSQDVIAVYKRANTIQGIISL